MSRRSGSPLTTEYRNFEEDPLDVGLPAVEGARGRARSPDAQLARVERGWGVTVS